MLIKNYALRQLLMFGRQTEINPAGLDGVLKLSAVEAGTAFLLWIYTTRGTIES